MTRPAGPADYQPVQQAYDTVADDYAAHLPDTRAEAALDLAMLDHFAATVRTGGGAVLDAGCGAGRMTRYLADQGCSVEGLDPSPAMVAAARRDHPDLTFAVLTCTSNCGRAGRCADPATAPVPARPLRAAL